LPARHIERLRLIPDLVAGAVEFELVGQGQAEVIASLDGEVAGRWAGPAGRGRIDMDRVVPWHPDSPRLYDVKARLLADDGRVADQVDGYFGLRTIDTKDGVLSLNGEPYIQRLVLDQGYFAGGLMTAPSDEALRQDIELAKSFGFNGARKHQKIEDPRWLYWADKLGFLVWSEMPSFYEHTAESEGRLLAEWADVVLRDRDHPSVVAWVVANESFGFGSDIDPSIRSSCLMRLYHLTHDLDDTRPTISNDGWEHAVSDICTVHDYSPPATLAQRYRRIDPDLFKGAHEHPTYGPGYSYRGEPIMVTEFGGIRVTAPGGWGWLEVQDRNQFLDVYRGLIDGLMDPGPVRGFCYTQLTDVQQEQNGLLTADRVPKVDPDLLRPITQTPKRR
jgi:beta-galactosidase/beta-glucuronidase